MSTHSAIRHPLDRSVQLPAPAESTSSQRDIDEGRNRLRRFIDPRPEPSNDERLQLLIDAVVDYGIFVLDPQGVVQTWNSGAQKLKGYAPDEIIGRHFSVFYPAEAVAAGWPAEELQRARKEGRFEDEGWRVRKDGSRFWANVVITALRDASGELTGFAKITRDLTERRLHEERLRASEARLRLLIESVQDYAIFMLDPDGTVRGWNSGAQAIKGYQAHEIVGRHFSVFYTPEDQQAGKPALELRTAAAQGRVEDEGWRVRKDGSLFWANVVVTRSQIADRRAARIRQDHARHDRPAPPGGPGAVQPAHERVPGDARARAAQPAGAGAQRIDADAAGAHAQPDPAQQPRHHRPPDQPSDAAGGRPAGRRAPQYRQGQAARASRRGWKNWCCAVSRPCGP